jgi:hypothetical protein
VSAIELGVEVGHMLVSSLSLLAVGFSLSAARGSLPAVGGSLLAVGGSGSEVLPIPIVRSRSECLRAASR